MPRASRQAARVGLAVATTIVTALSLAGPLSGVAQADKDPVPSQQRLDRATKAVAEKQRGIEQIQAALDAAQGRLSAAIVQAEVASESYNGALWRLREARTENREAQARALQAAADVEAQRGGIISLVTESYQNGTELTTATALMSDEGPEGLMNRYGVVQSAGDSMEARYDRFREASAAAEAYAAKASRTQHRQESMAREARQLRDAAGAAAAAAGTAANQIATQKATLVEELAKAQNISVALAKQRQEGLERLAEQKAAAAARAQHEAEEAALRKAAKDAARKAAAAGKVTRGDRGSSDASSGGDDSTPVPPVTAAPPIDSSPPAADSSGVSRALAYARAQIGKPYRWGATGPSSFDCSGLTMRAWQAGGKSLPHYSAAQFTMGTRISIASVKPGDLLFWSHNGSPGGIHHVALAIGGGQFIEAPRTGVPVRYNSIYNWWPDYAVRL